MAKRIPYIPNRVIDTNGISDGATIDVFQTGTTTRVSIYSDEALATPIANPYTVVAGAAVPAIYHGETANIRVRVKQSDGTTISDDDPFEAPVTDVALASTDAGKGVDLIAGAARSFQTVDDMLDHPAASAPEGTVWRADSFTYIVAASGATDEHLTTAGGVKLYVQPPFNFAAFGCGAAADSTARFTNALESVNGAAIAVTGTIRIDGAVSYGGPVNIWSEGENGVIDCSGGGSFSFVGGLTAIPDLSADITKGGNLVSFAAAHGLAVDDVFCVYNPTDYSYSPARPSYRDGDWIKVATVNSTTQIKMWGQSPDTYAVADMDCYKMDGEGVSIRGVRLIPSAASVVILTIQEHKSVNLVIGCDRGSQDTGIQVLRCYDVDVRMLPATVVLGNAYPVSVGNSKRVRVDAGMCRSDRHCMGFGGSDAIGCVPNRDIQVSNCNLVNIVEGTGAADIHGNCDTVMYSNCILEGATLGGRNVTYSNCVVRGRDASSADGLAFFGSEIGGGYFRLHNCHIVTGGASANFGLIHFSLLNLTDDIVIDIKNLTVENYDATATTTRLLMLSVGSSGVDPAPTDQIDIRMDGVNYQAASLFNAVRIIGDNDISGNASLSIQNFVAPSCSFVSAANAANLNMPMRLPRQTVSEEITYTTAEAFKLGTAQTLKHTYPRRPLASVSFHKTDGTSYNPGGATLAMPYLYDVETVHLYMGVKSTTGANFDVGSTGVLVGQAWIDEL